MNYIMSIVFLVFLFTKQGREDYKRFLKSTIMKNKSERKKTYILIALIISSVVYLSMDFTSSEIANNDSNVVIEKSEKPNKRQMEDDERNKKILSLTLEIQSFNRNVKVPTYEAEKVKIEMLENLRRTYEAIGDGAILSFEREIEENKYKNEHLESSLNSLKLKMKNIQIKILGEISTKKKSIAKNENENKKREARLLRDKELSDIENSSRTYNLIIHKEIENCHKAVAKNSYGRYINCDKTFQNYENNEKISGLVFLVKRSKGSGIGRNDIYFPIYKDDGGNYTYSNGVSADHDGFHFVVSKFKEIKKRVFDGDDGSVKPLKSNKVKTSSKRLPPKDVIKKVTKKVTK